MLLSDAFKEYLNEGLLRRKAKHTMNHDAYYGRHMLRFFGDVPLSALTPERVKAYLLAQQERGISDYTYQTYYKHVKAFVRWSLKEELITENPIAKIPSPRLPILLPKVLTEKQVESLFAAVKRDQSQYGKRNLVIMATFLSTGIRSNELSNLKLDDVVMDSHYLLIREGKGKKQRPVPFGNKLRKYLWRYLSDWRNDLNTDSDWLFPNQLGRQFRAPGVQKMVRTYMKEIGLNHGSHVLRHSYATMYLRSGGNVEKLRMCLGHASLEITSCYLHLVPEDLVRGIEQLDPLDTLGL